MTTATSTRPAAVAARPRPRPRRRIRVSRVLLGALAVVLALVWVFPVYWMVNSALLPNVILQNTTPTWLPFGGSFDNFSAVVEGGTFFPALGMSVAVALITVVCCLAFAFLAIHHVWRVAPASTSVIRNVVVAIAGAVAAAAWSTPGFLVVVKLGILGLGGLFLLCIAGEFGNPIALTNRARHVLLGRPVDQQ